MREGGLLLSEEGQGEGREGGLLSEKGVGGGG